MFPPWRRATDWPEAVAGEVEPLRGWGVVCACQG